MMRNLFCLLIMFLHSEMVLMAQPISKGSVTFKAEGEGLAMTSAGGAKMEGDVKLGAGNKVEGGRFSLKVSDLKTGMDLRDRHLCEALKCAKNPSIHFTLDPLELKEGTAVTGEMVMAGVSHKVAWKILKLSGKSLVIDGVIKLTDFGIDPPGYQGMKVSNEVEVKVEITL